MKHKLKALLLMTMVLLVAASASAAVLDCEAYDSIVGATTFSEPTVQGACYHFEWQHSPTATDFNNYVIHVSGDQTTEDFNLSSAASSWSVCQVEPGDEVTLYVRSYDGNAEGHFCSFDYNVTALTGSVVGSAMFFTYAMFGALGAIIGIVIIVGVGLYAIKHMGLTKMLKR